MIFTIILKKQSLCNPASYGLSCTPLALCPEARNWAGVIPSAPTAF